MKAISHLLLSAICAFPLLAGAAEPAPGQERPFGAFAAPAALPPGGLAAYGYMGVPEVGAGYRQGVGPLELDAQLKLNYFQLSLAVEGAARLLVYSQGRLQIAPSLAVGAVFDTGSRYIDQYNFGYVGLRLVPGGTVSWRAAETVSAVGELQVPIDLPLTRGGGARYTPMAGGGAELYLGEDVTAGAMADLGVDVVKQPLGVPKTRFAFALRVGLGYRFF